jgi:hypothetical protein
MNSFALFTDVSMDPQRRLGLGAYLLVPATLLETAPQDISRGEISAQLRLRMFTETSSTRLEVQTVLWLWRIIGQNSIAPIRSLRVHTDSQCIAGLPGRRAAWRQLFCFQAIKETFNKYPSLSGILRGI